jgi:hypothetical protein
VRKLHLLWIPGALAAFALLVWATLPETVQYEFGDETALTGDADRGEWVDGWYWSPRVAAQFAKRRLGPGADLRCTGSGDPVQSIVGNNRLYRRLTCPTRFDAVAGRRFSATVRVENRNLATVVCDGCPADPAQRRSLLSLADRFVQLTHRAIPFYDENGHAAPAHLAQAERLETALERWPGRNAEDAEYRELAETTAECVGLLRAVISAPEDDLATTNAYNECVTRFGEQHERLSDAFGPQPPV